MDNIENIVMQYTLRLGIAPCMSGFDCFNKSVIIYIHSEVDISLTAVCRDIGKERAVGAKAVIRLIDYAVKAAKELRTRLSEIAGFPIAEENIRPKYVICLVAKCIKRDYDI